MVPLGSNESSTPAPACPLSLGGEPFQSAGLLSAVLSITSPGGLTSEHGRACNEGVQGSAEKTDGVMRGGEQKQRLPGWQGSVFLQVRFDLLQAWGITKEGLDVRDVWVFVCMYVGAASCAGPG